MGSVCFASSGSIHQWLGATHTAAFVDLAISIPLGAGCYFGLCKVLRVAGIERPLEILAKRFRRRVA
jgi:hypothetical protein